jgi:type IV pilus assembly protein PilM
MDWERMLNIGPVEVFGLDVGSSAVKLIRLRKDNDSYAVTAAAIADIVTVEEDEQEDDFSRDTSELRKVNTVKAIRECLEFVQVQTKLAVCSVCGPQVAVRDFKFPLLPTEEVESAVMLEATQSCPFNVKDGAVDYQLISVVEGETKGVLVAATNAVIRNKIQMLQEASLDCVLMDIDGLALLNCFNACERREAGRPTSVLNVGSSYTNLAIIGDNDWPFIRDVSYAGNDIIEEIANEKNVSTEAVRKALFGSSDESKLELHDSLEKACLKLTADVTKTLRYYTAQEKIVLAEKIYVCGGFALAKGFVQILNSQLPAEAVLWNPFNKIRCNMGFDHRGVLQKNVLQKSGTALTVAAGLAMRSV